MAALPQVLIVEDEAIIAMELEGSVKDLGYSVLGPALSLDAANALLDESEPDAALLDINVQRGLVTPTAWRLRQAGIPFVVISGFVTMPDAPFFAHAPFLSKPLNPVVLQQVLAQIIH